MSKLNSEFNYRYQTIGETIWGLPTYSGTKRKTSTGISV